MCTRRICASVYIYHEASLVDCKVNDSCLGLGREFSVMGVGKISERYKAVGLNER